MGERIKVIFREFKKSEMTHYGKTGAMTSLDKETGQAQVTFDDGESVTIDACCLQSLEAQETPEAEAARDEPEISN